MKKAGGMWVTDSENFFDRIFEKSYDKYDPLPVEEALKHAYRRRTAIDGGAHYGTVSRQIQPLFDKILAFEPNAETYECLVRNTELYDNIVCHKRAIGDARGSVSVGIAPEKRQFIGTDKEWMFCNSGCIQVLGAGDIPMIRIDDLRIEDLDFLKLDIEGMEYAALLGARQTLERCRPAVLIEDKSLGARYGMKGSECSDFLGSLGYECRFSGPHGDYVYAYNILKTVKT